MENRRAYCAFCCQFLSWILIITRSKSNGWKSFSFVLRQSKDLLAGRLEDHQRPAEPTTNQARDKRNNVSLQQPASHKTTQTKPEKTNNQAKTERQSGRKTDRMRKRKPSERKKEIKKERKKERKKEERVREREREREREGGAEGEGGGRERERERERKRKRERERERERERRNKATARKKGDKRGENLRTSLYWEAQTLWDYQQTPAGHILLLQKL